MKDGHIKFETMSDLYDNSIATNDEQEKLLDHIDNCPVCKKEYDQLKNMMRLVSGLREQEVALPDFSTMVIHQVKSRKRKKTFYRAVPAVAASVLMVTGFGLYNTGLFTNAETSNYALETTGGAVNDSERVIEIIQKHDARILSVTGLYVEGEVSIRDYNLLRRELGFRKVTYSMAPKTRAGMTGTGMRNNFENVGIHQGNGNAYPADSRRDSEEYVRFRVYR